MDYTTYDPHMKEERLIELFNAIKPDDLDSLEKFRDLLIKRLSSLNYVICTYEDCCENNRYYIWLYLHREEDCTINSSYTRIWFSTEIVDYKNVLIKLLREQKIMMDTTQNLDFGHINSKTDNWSLEDIYIFDGEENYKDIDIYNTISDMIKHIKMKG